MRFDVLTLFPDMLKSVLHDSIIGRAYKKGIIELNFINIRDYSQNKHKTVDDYPYGGGNGMVMCPEPIYYAYLDIVKDLSYKPYTIYLTPQGKVFNQQTAFELSKKDHIIFICGHYEGVDQRVLDEIVDFELSVGDFVLTGGEIPAMAVIDAVSRLVPSVLSSEDCYKNESIVNGLLEHPQYTRPHEFLGKKVPEVLISGNHKNIEKWQREQSIITTYKKRPELLKNVKLSKEELEIIKNQ